MVKTNTSKTEHLNSVVDHTKEWGHDETRINGGNTTVTVYTV